jgi:hypothetical protein
VNGNPGRVARVPRPPRAVAVIRTVAASASFALVLASGALLLALLFSTGCQKRQASGAWEIIPGQRIGLVNRTEGEIDLQMAIGAENVRQTSVMLGEGETAPGTVAFPDDSTRRVEVLWHDVQNRRYPALAILQGEKSLWQLPRGVTLGTTLHELEQTNGRPFTLAGFGWDYAGVVLSWNGGALDSVLGPWTKLYVTPPPSRNGDSLYAQAMGDRPFSSSSHPMRAINPKVHRIRVEFPPPGTATDTGGTAATDTMSTSTAGRGTSASSGAAGARGVSPLEIREDGNGQTFTYPVSTRFTVMLDERKNPGHTLTVDPEGIIGRVASVPSVDPPLYAVRFEAARPGRATIRSREFLITVVVTKPGQAPRP